MRYRELGKTGLKVSEIGFGTIPVLSGNVPVLPEYYSPDVDEAVDIMMHAYNMGCNLYDTAIPEEYGDAEYKLGVFAEKVGREHIIISDKVEKMEEAGAKKIILKGVLSEKLLQELRRMEETGKKRGKGSKETQGTGSTENRGGRSGENRGGRSGENRGTSADSITDLKIGEGNTAFLYNGDMSRLLKLLAEEKPRDVSITEPTLEEIFMNYYE